MTELVIIIDDSGIISATEWCITKDTIKYVEGFRSWQTLLHTLSEYMEHYSSIRVSYFSDEEMSERHDSDCPCKTCKHERGES